MEDQREDETKVRNIRSSSYPSCFARKRFPVRFCFLTNVLFCQHSFKIQEFFFSERDRWYRQVNASHNHPRDSLPQRLPPPATPHAAGGAARAALPQLSAAAARAPLRDPYHGGRRQWGALQRFWLLAPSGHQVQYTVAVPITHASTIKEYSLMRWELSHLQQNFHPVRLFLYCKSIKPIGRKNRMFCCVTFIFRSGSLCLYSVWALEQSFSFHGDSE